MLNEAETTSSPIFSSGVTSSGRLQIHELHESQEDYEEGMSAAEALLGLMGNRYQILVHDTELEKDQRHPTENEVKTITGQTYLPHPRAVSRVPRICTQYPAMLINALNSQDVPLVQSFWSLFSSHRPRIKKTHYLPHTDQLQQAIVPWELSGLNYVVRKTPQLTGFPHMFSS